MNYAVREALASFRRSPVLLLLSATMIGLALYVVGLFGLVAHNLNLTLGEVEDRVQVIAYLRDDATSEQVGQAVDELAARSEVRVVHYISKLEALDRAREELPEWDEVFSDPLVNPLPASLEIQFERGFRDSQRVVAIAQLARAYPFVEDVQFGEDWIDDLARIRQAGAMATGVLGFAFGMVAALIIGFAIRMAVIARQDEITIMRLVGAKNSFIRLPFLLEGGLTGLAGGLIAVILTLITFQAVARSLTDLAWIPGLWVLGGLLAGGAFGLVASGLAIRRYLREV